MEKAPEEIDHAFLTSHLVPCERVFLIVELAGEILPDERSGELGLPHSIGMKQAQ